MINFENSLIPGFHRVRQTFDSAAVADVNKEVKNGISPYADRFKPGAKIGIAVGSRGIYQYAKIVKAVVETVIEAGANPFLVPAMGSHGGATAEGQIQVLDGYGITEETMGAPILSSMETVIVGETSQGMPVHFDKNASELDGVIMVNRIKPHTDFKGIIESGICKQMVIGLGKHKGAINVHRHGAYGLKTIIPEAAGIIIENAPIIMGVAVIENAYDRTAKIEILPSEEILSREPALLEEAKSLMPSLPFEKIDVLLLQEMGKNVSGSGLDPNIIGRFLIRGVEDQLPDIYRVVVMDLTEESHGNAIGTGFADIITKKLYDKIDFSATYINCCTSGFLERGFIPLVMDSDKEALDLALNCCNRYLTKEDARVAFVKNTLDISELVVSDALLEELLARGDYIEDLGEVNLEWDGETLVKLFP